MCSSDLVATAREATAQRTLPNLQIGSEFVLGKNTTGEACSARMTDQRSDGIAYQHFNIYCAGWEQRSAFITRFIASTRPLNFWLTESNWRKDREGTLECDAAIKPITLAADWPAQSQTCRMESGGWPALLFATRIAGRDYVGQAIPSVFPLLEEAIQIIEGKKPAQADRSQLVNASLRFIESQLRNV